MSNPEEEDLTVRGKWADLLPSIPEGSNYLHHTDRGEGMPLFGWRRRYWTFLLKLAKNRPSWTIQAQPGPAVGPFHWSNRRLSVRELSRLQTFPDDVNIVGGKGSAQKQLGNAVPSLLAEVIGRAIRQQCSTSQWTLTDSSSYHPDELQSHRLNLSLRFRSDITTRSVSMPRTREPASAMVRHPAACSSQAVRWKSEFGGGRIG